jgi:DnaJ-class molecular chaperone
MKGKCLRCDGKGRIDCPVCHGKGKVRAQDTGTGSKHQWEVCPNGECRGLGKITCPECQGSGWL